MPSLRIGRRPSIRGKPCGITPIVTIRGAITRFGSPIRCMPATARAASDVRIPIRGRRIRRSMWRISRRFTARTVPPVRIPISIGRAIRWLISSGRDIGGRDISACRANAAVRTSRSTCRRSIRPTSLRSRVPKPVRSEQSGGMSRRSLPGRGTAKTIL